MTTPPYRVDAEFVGPLESAPGSDDVEARRAWLRAAISDSGETRPPVGVDEWSIASPEPGGGVLGLRVYTPEVEGPKPALVYCHGGGFAANDLAINDVLCRDLAVGAGCVVVLVDYRLSPEHRYPAAFDDCWQALRWVAEFAEEIEVDPTRLCVGGASAGGALATAVAIAARDRGAPSLAYLHLVNPLLDDRLETPSSRAFTDTPLMTREAVAATWDRYLPEGGAEPDAHAAPARLADFRGLPPTYLEVAQLDPLRDEGIAFATQLLAAGVEVELHLHPGTFHGSEMIRAASLSQQGAAVREAALRRATARA